MGGLPIHGVAPPSCARSKEKQPLNSAYFNAALMVISSQGGSQAHAAPAVSHAGSPLSLVLTRFEEPLIPTSPTSPKEYDALNVQPPLWYAEKHGRKLFGDEISLHNMAGATGNRKFISPNGKCEIVYKPNGEIETNPLNMGTYNRHDPQFHPYA